MAITFVSCIVRLTLILLAALPASSAHILIRPESKRATMFNGYSELYLRTYGNITYIGPRSWYAVGSNNVAVNQGFNVTQQLPVAKFIARWVSHSD
ncbi:hypothetical protein FRC08_018852 [Ceratobasidium sp. 394]|nr:hypothetical protein FRC08_018852 [Ceratobasidium sp. 394]